jgi:thiamine biosynthesis protein ThiS
LSIRVGEVILVRITVNDELRDMPDELSLQELIRRLSLPAERLAIELNRNVVRRAEWPATILHEDDRIEIVHFVGGGSAKAGRRQTAGPGHVCRWQG